MLEVLFDGDDRGQTRELPFPINFFGQKFTHLCVTNNGAVFPTNDPTQSFCTEYDYGVGDLALSELAPIMAVLALDLDSSEDLLTSDGRNVERLENNINGTTRTAVLANGVVTVTSASHGLLSGDHAAFLATGTVLDTAGTRPVTVIDTNSFSVPVPGISDLDPGTSGVQTAVTNGRWTYANSVGVPRMVYFGTTTVGGRDAVAVTWYRIPHNDDDNPRDRSATIQLVLVKGTSGDDTVGWDFAVEYNIGTMTDDEDGYDASNPFETCNAWPSAWSNQDDPANAAPPANPTDDARSTCRWGMGFGSFTGAIDLQSVSTTNGEVIITTASPHGVVQTAGSLGVRLSLPGDPDPAATGPEDALGVLEGARVWAEVASPTTFKVSTSASVTATFSPPLQFDAADVYELFSTSPIDALIDSAGTTSLVENSLNSNVKGRYRFEMVGGLVQSFAPPSMNGAPTIVNPAIVDNPPPQVSPLLPPPPPAAGGSAPSTSAPTTSTPTTTVPAVTTVPPATSTPAPVPAAGGVLPQLVPGASQVLEDGVPADVEVFVADRTDLVLRGDGFRMSLAGECSFGCAITTDAEGRQVLELESNGLARVEGEGFLAGTPVYVWLFSEPTFLGELTVNADGTFTGSVPLGDIEVGNHTLQVNGTSFDGKPRTANLGVVVAAPDVTAVLPATGGDVGVVGWVVFLASLGGVLVLTSRRRIVTR